MSDHDHSHREVRARADQILEAHAGALPAMHEMGHLRRAQIVIDPKRNARVTIYRKPLIELRDSIRKIGLLQPIGVRRLAEADDDATFLAADGAAHLGRSLRSLADDGVEIWTIVWGSRRLRALDMIYVEEGLSADEAVVPVVFVDADEARAYDMMLAENLHREDVPPWDIGNAVVDLHKKGYDLQQIAARLSLVIGESQKVARLHRLAVTARGLIPPLYELWKRNLKDFDEEKAFEVAQKSEMEQEAFLEELTGGDGNKPTVPSGSGGGCKRRSGKRPGLRTIERAYQSLKQGEHDEHDDGLSDETRAAYRTALRWVLGGSASCPIRMRKRQRKSGDESSEPSAPRPPRARAPRKPRAQKAVVRSSTPIPRKK